MRIVVTGATGNVGSQLLPQLLAHPDVTSVVGVARRLPPDRDQRVDWRALDVAADDLRPVLRGADVVVHLAWLLQPAHDRTEMARVNLGGTRRVLAAVEAEGVRSLVHASSVGAYSPGPKDLRVDESYPTGGISSSTYSRHKAEAERMLDALEGREPRLRVVRLRPGIVLQAAAASSIARYFLGPFLPQSLVRRSLLPVVPDVPDLALQALHARDMAAAYVLAATRPVRGAFNVASEPVLDAATVAEALGARRIPVPRAVVRGLVDGLWRLHVVPVDPGWVDLATRAPLLDTTRARTELGWSPTVSATAALVETVDAMARGAGAPTPVLRPRPSVPGRLAEVARALLPGAHGTG
jgi:UDP-glucose 4-epimerase